MAVRRSHVLAAVALVALGSGFGWAASSLFSPPAPLPEGQAFSIVEASEQELSRSVNLNAAASWTGGFQLINLAPGVLTQRIIASGEPVATGDIVYTVGLSPVAVAAGDIPAFRDLVPGVRGADVGQMQQMLVDTGHRAAAPDGSFDAATLAQLKSWQRASNSPVTGTAPLGSLLFVGTLPAVVGWDDAATPAADGSVPDAKGVVGSRLVEGDSVAQFLPSTPSFTIDLPVGQRRLVDTGMPVTLRFGQHQWAAVVAAVQAPRDDGSAIATLDPADGNESICGEDCNTIPVEGVGSISATIEVVAPTTGTVVPTSALAVAADGSTAVVSESGEVIPVTTKAIVGGQALIEGVAVGTKVRASGQAAPTDSSGADSAPQPSAAPSSDADSGGTSG